ncbi:MAG: GNAT family N-acetyltransferase [Gammaproteobacteria bacterium]|nr:GNAT family N-acetyltransferase [Gammaproteobacteria bacterium]
MTVTTRPITLADKQAWLEMRVLLWPENPHDHRIEVGRWFAGELAEPQAVIIAADGAKPVGFAELSIRAYAEKCDTRNVAYLEGWFVLETERRRGAGRALIEAGKQWGRKLGCSEFASDAFPGNKVSIAAHLATGFEDAGVIRCFKQKIQKQD